MDWKYRDITAARGQPQRAGRQNTALFGLGPEHQQCQGHSQLRTVGVLRGEPDDVARIDNVQSSRRASAPSARRLSEPLRGCLTLLTGLVQAGLEQIAHSAIQLCGMWERPLTVGGNDVGYELRLSWYES